jgi:phenylpropionate dioxygenase-like ring-hydroxylating dioxygenase large terminal subunit
MTYLENAWYVAAWHEEVTDAILARRICDQEIIVYRGKDASPVVLEDRCAHRFAPLHRGSLSNGEVECGYHGLRYNARGACTHNPHGDRTIPSFLKVRSYPAIERHGFVWAWMGRPDRADPDMIPDFRHIDKTASFRTVSGYTLVNASYQLITDNLMDLSHVGFLHAGSLGTAEAIAASEVSIVAEGQRVTARTWIPNQPAAPHFAARMGGYADPVDTWLDICWEAPAAMSLSSGATPTGRPRDEGIVAIGCHILTPESAFKTHYFWTHSRKYQLDDDAVSGAIRAALRRAFNEEDKPMIEAQQRVIGTADLMSLQPGLISTDAAPIRVRRLLRRLIDEQDAGAT